MYKLRIFVCRAKIVYLMINFHPYIQHKPD